MFRLIFHLEFSLGIFSLGFFAWELWLGIFAEAGGTGLLGGSGLLRLGKSAGQVWQNRLGRIAFTTLQYVE